MRLVELEKNRGRDGGAWRGKRGGRVSLRR